MFVSQLFQYRRSVASDQNLSFSKPALGKMSKLGALLFVLFGLLMLPFGVLMILIALVLFGAHSGAEIDLAQRRVRHFGAWFFIRSGKWQPMLNYERIIVLSRGVRVTRANELGVERKEARVYHEVYLTDRAHRARFHVSDHPTVSKAIAAAKELSGKLALPLEDYAPGRTAARR